MRCARSLSASPSVQFRVGVAANTDYFLQETSSQVALGLPSVQLVRTLPPASRVYGLTDLALQVARIMVIQQ
jgi:hypothetical protein